MGGGFSFSLKLGDSSMRKVSGKIVGMSGQDDVDVDVKNHSTIADGVYSVPASKGEAVKAILSEDALTEVNKDNVKKVVDDVYVDIADLKKSTQNTSTGATLKITGAPAKGDAAREQNGLIQISVDNAEYEKMVANKVKSLLKKYAPGVKRENLTAENVYSIMNAMGVLSDKNSDNQPIGIDEQLEAGLNYLIEQFVEAHGENADRAKSSLMEPNLSPRGVENGKKIVASYNDFVAKSKTAEGREELKQDVLQGFVEVLAATEDFLLENPRFRGSLLVKIPQPSSGAPADLNAYAQLIRSDDGANSPLLFATAYTHRMMSSKYRNVYGKFEPSLGHLHSWHVDVKSDTTQSFTTGFHETTHVLHFDAALDRLGIGTGSQSKSIADQLSEYGALGETALGSMHAAAYGIEPSTSVSSLSDYQREQLIYHIGTLATKEPLTSEDADNLIEKLNATLGFDYGVGDSVGAVLRNGRSLLTAVLDDSSNYENYISGYQVDARVNTYEKARKIVEDTLGMSPEQFVKELADAVNSDIGVDMAYLGSNGVPAEEVMDTLSGSSLYGRTSVMEAVAEARTLLRLIDNLTNSNLFGNNAQLKQMRRMVETIIGKPGASKSRTPKLSSNRTKELMNLYNKLQKVVSDMPWEYEGIPWEHEEEPYVN